MPLHDHDDNDKIIIHFAERGYYMKYNIGVNIEVDINSKSQSSEDVLDCICEDLPDGITAVIDNIIGKEVIKSIKIKSM